MDDEAAPQAHAFLFDNSVEGAPEPQLAFFTGRVLAALASADPGGTTVAQIRVGLPMLPDFATRTIAVHRAERVSGRTVSHDVDTYKYVIWEWLDSLSDGWHSVSSDRGGEIFRRHTGECVTLTALTIGLRDEIDRKLKETPGYVGAFVIDPGNPLHREGFVDGLIYAGAIMKGAVVQERTIDDEKDWELKGARAFRPHGLRWRPYGWLTSNGPLGLPSNVISKRGRRTAEAVLRKHGSTIETRVISAIDEALSLRSSGRSFSFEAVGHKDDVLEAIMPEGKFTHYLFNRAHEKGSGKSTFFIDVLEIDPEDWRYLAAQFYFGLLAARPESLELKEWGDGYGMRFNVQIRVRGRSGKTAIVQTGWMMQPGKLPSLSSAMPGDRDADAIEPGEPPILAPGSYGTSHWASLWTRANTAGEQAASRTVPTPMFLAGYEPIAEGELGSAAVRVRDARRCLARWLVRNGLGNVDGKGGAVVFSPISSPSLERAVAWAKAFVLVLRLNGVEAEYESLPS